MAGLVTGHLVDSVVNGIQVVLLGQLRQLKLAGGGAVLGALWGNDPSLLVAEQLIKQFKRLQVWP